MSVAPAPNSVPPPAPRAWELKQRESTGLFVTSHAGTLLFRFDQAKGIIYAWDKKAGKEVEISVADLLISNSV